MKLIFTYDPWSNAWIAENETHVYMVQEAGFFNLAIYPAGDTSRPLLQEGGFALVSDATRHAQRLAEDEASLAAVAAFQAAGLTYPRDL